MSAANGESFTVKEVVLEIRDTVKDLASKLDRIDREGSIGTRAQLDDHEHRLRTSEERLSELEDTKVKRAELHEVQAQIAAVRLTIADRPEQIRQFHEIVHEVETLKAWRWRMVGASATVSFVVGTVAAASWHIWG